MGLGLRGSMRTVGVGASATRQPPVPAASATRQRHTPAPRACLHKLLSLLLLCAHGAGRVLRAATPTPRGVGSGSSPAAWHQPGLAHRTLWKRLPRKLMMSCQAHTRHTPGARQAHVALITTDALPAGHVFVTGLVTDVAIRWVALSVCINRSKTFASGCDRFLCPSCGSDVSSRRTVRPTAGRRHM